MLQGNKRKVADALLETLSLGPTDATPPMPFKTKRKAKRVAKHENTVKNNALAKYAKIQERLIQLANGGLPASVKPSVDCGAGASPTNDDFSSLKPSVNAATSHPPSPAKQSTSSSCRPTSVTANVPLGDVDFLKSPTQRISRWY
jgi:hypothetical protein